MCVNCISSRLYSYLNCGNFFFTTPPPHNYKEMILIFQLKKYHCLHRSPCLQDPPYYCENLEPQFTVRRKLKFDSASFPFLLFKSGKHMKHKKTHEWLFLINHVFLSRFDVPYMATKVQPWNGNTQIDVDT